MGTIRAAMYGSRLMAFLVTAVAFCTPLTAQSFDIRAALETALADGGRLQLPPDAPEGAILARSISQLNSRTMPATAELHWYFEGLEAMAARHGNWPWPILLEAAMLRRLALSGQQLLPFPGVAEGLSWSEAYFQKLLGAVKRDPSYRHARAMALDALELVGERVLGDDERELIKRELAHADPLPMAFVIQSRQERQAGRIDQSLRWLERIPDDGAVDRGILGLEKARTLRGLGRREEGRDAYFAGLRSLSELGRDAYRHDLARVLHPDSLAVFDSVATGLLEEFLRGFWAERDAVGANLPGERLDEHLQRWVIAHNVFRLHAPERRTQYKTLAPATAHDCIGPERDFLDLLWRLQPARTGDTRWEEQLLDHRGLVLLRHGRPYARVIGSVPGKPLGSLESRIIRFGLELGDDHELSERHFFAVMNESWLMRLHGRWRFLFFRPGQLGRYAPTTMDSFLPAVHWDYETLSVLISDYSEPARRLQNEPTFTSMLGAGLVEVVSAPGNCDPAVATVIATARNDARLMAGSDSDEPRLERQWNASARLYGLDHGSRSSLTLVAAIPVTELKGGSPLVPLRLGRFGSDSHALSVVDTTLLLRELKGQYAYGAMTIPMSDGSYTVGALMGREPDGGFHLSDRLRTSRAPGLRISQLLLGHEIVPIGIPFAGEAFPLTPFEYWAHDTPMLVGYEVSGATPGSEVEVITEVIRAGQRGSALRVSRRERVDDQGTTQRIVRLGLRNLQAGRYVVRVMVRHNGQTSSAERGVGVTR